MMSTTFGSLSGRTLVQGASPRHAVMRQIRHDHPQAAAQGILHDVAVVPAERPLAVDDEHHLRILVGTDSGPGCLAPTCRNAADPARSPAGRCARHTA